MTSRKGRILTASIRTVAPLLDPYLAAPSEQGQGQEAREEEVLVAVSREMDVPRLGQETRPPTTRH